MVFEAAQCLADDRVDPVIPSDDGTEIVVKALGASPAVGLGEDSRGIPLFTKVPEREIVKMDDFLHDVIH